MPMWLHPRQQCASLFAFMSIATACIGSTSASSIASSMCSQSAGTNHGDSARGYSRAGTRNMRATSFLAGAGAGAPTPLTVTSSVPPLPVLPYDGPPGTS